MAKKNTWGKIAPLIQLAAGAPYIRTALRHFDDASLLREVQKRNARADNKTSKEDKQAALDIAGFDDYEMKREWAKREMDRAAIAFLLNALADKNWSLVEEALAELEER